MATSVQIQKLRGAEIKAHMVEEAAKVFSSEYGVWGPLAEAKMSKLAKQGRRVKMGPDRLREQSLPKDGDNVLVRALVDESFAGYAFATRWKYEGRQMCWVTQLCVKTEYRKHGLAKLLLIKLREDEIEIDRGFGILSSHPAAIMAALRAFGRGIEEVNLDMIQKHAGAIMRSSPISYVKSAGLRGSLFEPGVKDGSICCAFTNFYVDHQEPLEVLKEVQQKVVWPFGELPEGCEYLVLVKAAEIDEHGKRVHRKENSSEF